MEPRVRVGAEGEGEGEGGGEGGGEGEGEGEGGGEGTWSRYESDSDAVTTMLSSSMRSSALTPWLAARGRRVTGEV